MILSVLKKYYYHIKSLYQNIKTTTRANIKNKLSVELRYAKQ